MHSLSLHRTGRRSIAALALAGVAFLPAGCATPPARADLRPIAAPESVAATDSLAAPETAWPSDNWWTEFQDPQLDTLIEEGLAGATNLRVAQARFAQAQAYAGQARAPLLPSVDVGAQGGVTQQSDNYLFPAGLSPRGWPDYGQAALSLSWNLDFWGRNRAALAAARSDAEAARAEAAATRLAVSAGIAQAYADLAGLYAERDAAAAALDVRTQTQALLSQRRDQGLENNGAVERANAALASARGEVAALDEAIARTRNGIAALMGAGPDRGRSIARPHVAATGQTGLPANIPAELIGRRPDIIAARLRVEAAASRIREARAAFYPNINLAGLVGMQALGLDSVFHSGSDFGTAGPAISLPLFDGGRLRGRYRGAEAEYTAAVAQYDGTLVQALREIADAATSERALDERLQRARDAERAASAAWTVANNRYRGGLATYLDVLAAEDALISTRRMVASLQSRAFALDVALIRALGGGFRS